MQRNMSYRKPVPVYVPSPPPATQKLPELFDALNQVEKDVSLDASLSKIQQQTSGSNYRSELPPPPPFPPKLPEELDSWNIIQKEIPPLPGNWVEISVERRNSEGHSSLSGLPPLPQEDTHEHPSKQLEKDIPPLPNNWREILAERTSDEVTTKERPASTEPRKEEDIHQPPISSTDLPKKQKNPSIKGHGYEGSYTTLPGTQSYRGRGLPRDYRPPTPPLRSKSQRPELSSLGMNSERNASQLDVPAIRGMPYHHNYPSSYYYSQTRSGGSITATHSFRTEKTAVSTNPSTMGWSRGKATPSDKAMYNNYQALIPQRKVAVNIVVQDHTSMISVHGGSSWKYGLKKWAKKVWRSMSICK